MNRLAGPSALPLQIREQPLASIDVNGRAISVIWTTGATVQRRRFTGWDTSVPFNEELLVTSAAVDLSRLKAGAPVLDSHMTGSTDFQRAVVEDAWLSGGKGHARLRFPSRGIDPAADRLFEMASERVIRNISVGYRINRVRIVEATSTAIERRIIEHWTPYELSFVTVPADADAQTVAGGGRAYPLTVTRGPASGGLPIGDARATLLRIKLKAKLRGHKL